MSTVVAVPVAEFLLVLSRSSLSRAVSSSLSPRANGVVGDADGSMADMSILDGSGGGEPSCVSSPTRLIEKSSSSCTESGESGGGVCIRTCFTLEVRRAVSGAVKVC